MRKGHEPLLARHGIPAKSNLQSIGQLSIAKTERATRSRTSIGSVEQLAAAGPAVWSLPARQGDCVVKALNERAEALVVDLVETITTAPRESEQAWVPPPVVGAETCLANVRSVLAAMVTPSAFDAQSAIVNGMDRARQRLAVSAIIESDRIAFRRLWRVLADEAARHPAIDGQVVQYMTGNLYAVEELFATAMFTGYRQQYQRQMIDEMSQGTMMMDVLLHGHAQDTWRLWEIANYLRLPTEGPFVVIAADVPCVGYEALPDVQSKLRSLDIFSAWRLLPDLQVGIAHVASEQRRNNILALLNRMATQQIGVSACFDDLRHIPNALHFAKVSLRGQSRVGSKVTVFDGSILATAAVSAPGVMVRSAAKELDGFSDVSCEEREMLIDTFQAWIDNDASVRATAEVLFVHPNTVRKRLHRIEVRTGRNLTRPRDVIELGLALEVQRRLM